MKYMKQNLIATILAAFFSTTTVQAAERCNIYTADSCLGINWKTVTADQIKSVNIDITDANGRNALHWAAARSSNPNVINALLAEGADLHTEDKLGYTPLHTAVEGKNSYLSIINSLLNAGAKINADSTGIAGTPLHLAVIHSSPEIIEALLNAGANPNAGDFDSMTPLHTAAFANKNPAVLTALLAAGADVNARGKTSSRAQQAAYTPLHAAAKGTKNPEVVITLLKAGAELEAKNRDNYTPLHIAADANRTPAVITAFIEAGAQVNARNKEGYTPLHLAAYTNYPEMLETLVNAGADVNARASDGLTPLHLAAIGNGDPAVIAELIISGAETYLEDDAGNTAYQYAQDNEELKSTDGDGYRMLEISQ